MYFRNRKPSMLDLAAGSTNIYRQALLDFQRVLSRFVERDDAPGLTLQLNNAYLIGTIIERPISLKEKIVEACFLYLAFSYRSDEAVGKTPLLNEFLKHVYALSQEQLDYLKRVARSYTQERTLYQSPVFNHSLSAYLLQHYWNPEYYPQKEVPLFVQELQLTIAHFLSELSPVQEEDVQAAVSEVEEKALVHLHDAGYDLPEISDSHQTAMTNLFSEKVERISTSITRIRELYCPTADIEDIDEAVDSILVEF